jgi:K319-like protein/calcineurin-like phosphoesterase family protein
MRRTNRVMSLGATAPAGGARLRRGIRLSVLVALVVAAPAASAGAVDAGPVASTTASTVVTTFQAEADSRVHEASPTTNYGAYPALRVVGAAKPDVESYLRFTVSGVGGSVQRATLRLFATTDTADGPKVAGTSNDWVESTITWANRPAPTTLPTDDEGAIPAGTWIDLDVTPLVTTDGTFSFVLVATSGDVVDFSSRNSSVTSQRPELVVETLPSGTPVATSPPTISGRAQEGETLTAAPGTWRGSEPMTFEQQWQRCSPSGAGCTDISGATAMTYTLAPGDVGSTVRVAITATNADGTGTAASGASPVVLAPGEIRLAAAGDIASCMSNGDEATAQLLGWLNPDRVLALGDIAYPDGTAADFANCYDPTWGQYKAITSPTVGNHEYNVDPAATAYFDYFGAAAGERGKGYYSFEVGTWHVIALNSNCANVGGCAAGSPQEQWLRADLAAHAASCTLAYWHHPRFTSGFHGNSEAVIDFWRALYEAGADIVLSGHDHNYERFVPQTAEGAADSGHGIREFVVGTGGESHSGVATPVANSEVRNADTFGLLELILRPGGYDWQFVPEAGKTFRDAGSASCVTPDTSNRAPSVDAGHDQAFVGPNSTSLDGTVTDDGLPNPPAAVTTTWSQVSGPGAVTFGDAGALHTSASFPQAGTYVLRLTADDGERSAFDELTVTVTDPAEGGSPLYFSLSAGGSPGGVKVANEDIVFFDGKAFTLAFDGSDVGLGSLRIDAFSWLDADTLLLSFDADATVPQVGAVDDSDVVRFDATSLGATTAGSLSLFFDGSDVGLTATGHDVDAFEVLPDGRLLLSVTGSAKLPGVSAADEDLLAFTGSTGTETAGTFSLYFDGSDVGLTASGEDVDAAAVDASGRIYLSTTDAFSVDGAGGADEDVFVFVPTTLGATTTGTFSSLYFDGDKFGLGTNDVLAIDLP